MKTTLTVLRALWTFLAVAIAAFSLHYVIGIEGAGFPDQQPVFDSRPGLFWLHVGPAIVALFIGPFQVWRRLRRRFPMAHRVAGWVYVLAVTAASIGGFGLAWTAFGGGITTGGFVTLSVLWLGVTAMALTRAIRGDVAAHRRWMIRSLALTTSAVTLRLIIGIGPALGFDFDDSYRFAAWACWVTNLAVAEWYLARKGTLSLADWMAEPRSACRVDTAPARA